jgi:Transposase DDE domain
MHDLPLFIKLTEAKVNDKVLLDYVTLPPGSILVFDRAYRKYEMWASYTERGITWVTREIGDEYYETDKEIEISQECSENGIITDELITLGKGINKGTILKARRIYYKDTISGKELVFLTNNVLLTASQIADIYKRRWQIEVFFKRLKRHNPLRYFLGDNENAIKIQIWSALIADLLVQIIKDKLTRKWAFTNLSSIIKHHLMNYIDLFKFLNNPEEKLVISNDHDDIQLKLKL